MEVDLSKHFARKAEIHKWTLTCPSLLLKKQRSTKKTFQSYFLWNTARMLKSAAVCAVLFSITDMMEKSGLIFLSEFSHVIKEKDQAAG